MTLTLLAITLVLAIGASLLITPMVIGAARALKLFDRPDGGRRMHPVAVPRLGGISVYLAAALVTILLLTSEADAFPDFELQFLGGVFLGSAILFLVGLVDDVRGLSPGSKFAAQVLAAGIAWYFGARLDIVALGYGVGVPTGFLAFPLAMLWIVGVTNAFNFIDGLNGLAAGIAIVASLSIVALAFALGNFVVLIPAVALTGALLGFLHFNFPEARIFLGDSGSQSIGFLLAVLSMRGSVSASGAVLVVVPILAVFVPLMDVALAIIRRWLRKVPLSGADARHVHHRLLALGISPSRTSVLLWALAACMSGFGLLISLTAPFVAALVAILGLVGVVVLLIYGTNVLSYHELMVAGGVLMSAPARIRRVISDQIFALDVTAMVYSAKSIEEVSELLGSSASQFGFLGMELSGGELDRTAPEHIRITPQIWAWKLDYPIRLPDNTARTAYVLSIWCSPETSARPYGAERIARILGPVLEDWFAARQGGQVEITALALKRLRTPAGRRLRTTPSGAGAQESDRSRRVR